MTKNINYFDLGLHNGQETFMFIWHINYLRKNGYLKDCSVNIYGFEPTEIFKFADTRFRFLQDAILYGMDAVNLTKEQQIEKYGSMPLFSNIEANFMKDGMIFPDSSLTEDDAKNIHLYKKAVSKEDGSIKLYLSERSHNFDADYKKYKKGWAFEKKDVQPMDYLGSSIFESKTTGNIKSDIYEEVESVQFSKFIKDNVENYDESINILKMNIEGAEYLVLKDLKESDMLDNIDIFCGYDFLEDMKKIPELDDDVQKCENLIKDNKIDSKFIFFCYDHIGKYEREDFGLMSETIETILLKKGWE